MRPRILAAILTALLTIGPLSGCSTIPETQRKDELSSEKYLLAKSREAEKLLDRGSQLYASEKIVRYVNNVVRDLVAAAPGVADDFKFTVKIVRNPSLNVFALAHGVIYIHTGTLAKIDNEAQLAALLAHEVSHVVNRHPLRTLQLKQSLAVTEGIFRVATVAPYVNLLGALGLLGVTAAVSGYSQQLETEADSQAFQLIAAAGYDPKEAIKIYDFMEKDLEARKIDEPFFFSSHPSLRDRRANYAKFIAAEPITKSGRSGTERYRDTVTPLLLDNAEMDLALGRWAWAEDAIRKFIAEMPHEPRGYFQLGELFRERLEAGDLEKAERSYQTAIQHDPDYGPAHRGLGLVYLKLGSSGKAKDELRLYLALVPLADDRAYIEQYLKTESLGESGS